MRTIQQQFAHQRLANDYQLVNGVDMNAENPDNFQIPHPVLKKHVGVGHFVELRIDSPRFTPREQSCGDGEVDGSEVFVVAHWSVRCGKWLISSSPSSPEPWPSPSSCADEQTSSPVFVMFGVDSWTWMAVCCTKESQRFLFRSKSSFAIASRLPIPRKAASAANCACLGRDLPCSQL